MEGQGVLLLMTKQRLLVVDLVKLENLDSPGNEFPAAAVQMFDFVEKGFPLGAGFFIWRSKLYMVGGEKTRAGLSEKELASSSTANLDELFGTRGLSKKIFFSDLTKKDSITEFQEHSRTMREAKSSPIIEEIDGKVYFLSGPPSHYKYLLPVPSFEVYDPSLDRFEALPTPLFYVMHPYDDPDYTIRDHSVVGTTIYVRAGDQYYSYSISDRKWYCLGNSADEIPVPNCLLPGNNGKFVPAYKDVLICFSQDGLFAVLFPPNGGSPLIQCLDEVYIDDDMVLWRGVGVVVAIGENEMCIIRPKVLEIKNGMKNRIDFVTFRVEKLNSSAPAPAPTIGKTASNSQTSYHDLGNRHNI